MYNTIDWTKLGGIYTYQQTWKFMQDAYGNLFDGIAKSIGEKYVVSGVVETAGSATDGFIVVNGEILPFIGGAILTYVKVEQIVSPEQYDDGNVKDAYYTKRAKFVNISGVDTFPYTDLKRLPYANIMTSISNIFTMIKSIIGFEPEVILTGCEVSDIDPGVSLDIATGKVLFGEKLIDAPAYSGAYPVYLTEAGNYTLVLPVSGLYVKFDPHTSQRYVDVQRRATVKAPQILMFKTWNDRFDANGLGRWEMKGFKFVAEIQGRTPMGLWFDDVAVDNVTDLAYKNPGATGGEKLHELSIDEMPEHSHDIDRRRSGNGGSGSNWAWTDTGGIEENKTTNSSGGGEAHYNVPPFLVIVYVERA